MIEETFSSVRPPIDVGVGRNHGRRIGYQVAFCFFSLLMLHVQKHYSWNDSIVFDLVVENNSEVILTYIEE